MFYDSLKTVPGAKLLAPGPPDTIPGAWALYLLTWSTAGAFTILMNGLH